MPVAFVARAIVKDPTAVSAAPAPSASVSVATAPLVPTELRDPPLGTPASVHGAVFEEFARTSEKVALTWSILPSESLSNICRSVSAGAALSAGAVALKEDALLPAASATPPEEGAA